MKTKSWQIMAICFQLVITFLTVYNWHVLNQLSSAQMKFTTIANDSLQKLADGFPSLQKEDSDKQQKTIATCVYYGIKGNDYALQGFKSFVEALNDISCGIVGASIFSIAALWHVNRKKTTEDGIQT